MKRIPKMIPATNVTTMTYHSIRQLVSFEEVLSKSEKAMLWEYRVYQKTEQIGNPGPGYVVFDSDRLVWYL